MQTKYDKIEYIDEKRPVRRLMIDNGPYPVPIAVQQGRSGRWWARTEIPHPCPGNQPEHMWGSGETMHEAIHQLAQSVRVMNSIGCFFEAPKRLDLRIVR